MSWITLTATAILLVVGVTCSPIDVAKPATDLVPPEVESVPTPATELLPPSVSAEMPENNWPAADFVPSKKPATLFLINIYAVKNSTAEDSNDVLHDDVIEEVPDESSEPLAMFILVVEEEDEDRPVSLDEVAKDLEEEGFKIEKVAKNGETRLVKVDLNSAESMVKIDGEDKNNAIGQILADAAERKAKETTEQPELDESGKLMKIRRKRHLKKHYSTGCGGGCGGGGGYYQPQPVQYQPVIVPVQSGYQKVPQSSCNTCQQGGGGGGYGGYGGGHQGGGGSFAQSSAQASAQASSYGGGYGR